MLVGAVDRKGPDGNLSPSILHLHSFDCTLMIVHITITKNDGTGATGVLLYFFVFICL
jgi:hypothetical protein